MSIKVPPGGHIGLDLDLPGAILKGTIVTKYGSS